MQAETEKVERLKLVTGEIFKLFQASGLDLLDIYFVLWGYLLAVQDKINRQKTLPNRRWIQ